MLTLFDKIRICFTFFLAQQVLKFSVLICGVLLYAKQEMCDSYLFQQTDHKQTFHLCTTKNKMIF